MRDLGIQDPRQITARHGAAIMAGTCLCGASPASQEVFDQLDALHARGRAIDARWVVEVMEAAMAGALHIMPNPLDGLPHALAAAIYVIPSKRHRFGWTGFKTAHVEAADPQPCSQLEVDWGKGVMGQFLVGVRHVEGEGRDLNFPHVIGGHCKSAFFYRNFAMWGDPSDPNFGRIRAVPSSAQLIDGVRQTRSSLRQTVLVWWNEGRKWDCDVGKGANDVAVFGD